MNQFLAKITEEVCVGQTKLIGISETSFFSELLSLKPSSSASGRLVLRSKVKSNELSLNGGHFFP